jgi:hypothetical protein
MTDKGDGSALSDAGEEALKVLLLFLCELSRIDGGAGVHVETP